VYYMARQLEDSAKTEVLLSGKGGERVSEREIERLFSPCAQVI
jgi:hypothetical protein